MGLRNTRQRLFKRELISEWKVVEKMETICLFEGRGQFVTLTIDSIQIISPFTAGKVYLAACWENNELKARTQVLDRRDTPF